MIEKEDNASIGAYTTFGIGGTVRHLLRIRTEEDIAHAVAFSEKAALPLVYLGEGSNSIFADSIINAIVMKIEIHGFEVIAEAPESADIRIGAGENWDSVVARAVENGLSGIEAMSAIPGTAGAAPYQNVGAYGQEIKDTLVAVRAYDTKTHSFVELSRADCAFSYRDSIFKSGEKGRYVISSITLRLSKRVPSMPDYPGVRDYFKEKNIIAPSLADIRDAIIAIRSTKLPDPKKVKNAGSFFKNPIVSLTAAQALKAVHPDMVMFDAGEGKMKLSAGWLIEHAGLKGKNFGSIRVYENNALVLVNKDNASSEELRVAKDAVIEKVRELFGVTLEPEPVFVQ